MSELFDKSIRTLELPRVLQMLSDQAVSAEAKERALRVGPETEAEEVLLSLLPKLRNRRSRPSPALPPQQTFPEAPQAKAVRLPPPWIRPQPTSWWKQPYQGNPRKS